ncbi:50S ribosomal protein P1 [Candidatus Micrarchaeota archaeon CG10_big_fil_rev_8_21_14_0_10_60_32]|nr:MAG: 50S ribosomal protein P1 [Candidatus Micrarchaeota archaeon CG1_02_60_51]PIN96364.1 MAG: 50S ribosomal protein P1 [Candidatus Micrarchaeota archaeon CG10_big_fil_rev_8_21_14_0_10_60_32]PIO02035.1 MAG: 50S ribosomal protein P1 [Candidatus Micrarchaeota archaeon CG09_land_8_20_14_0_10_60_16]PIY91844.1 MAG: 50S ribosomal protein P1 [Candidatus Micrarchaeota archaeon CG_4_10_14_0_8_um_filter_60_7]
MKDVYAALLLHSAGKPIDEENVEKVLHAAGVTEDKTKIKALCVALQGVNIDEAVKQAAVVAAPAAAEAKKDEKPAVEEKSESEKEAEASAGLANLFG